MNMAINSDLTGAVNILKMYHPRIGSLNLDANKATIRDMDFTLLPCLEWNQVGRVHPYRVARMDPKNLAIESRVVGSKLPIRGGV